MSNVLGALKLVQLNEIIDFLRLKEEYMIPPRPPYPRPNPSLRPMQLQPR